MDVAMESNENSPDGTERRKKSERRTSILKPPKPRNPLQELDFDKEGNETVQPTRRVSFSRAQIQEFAESRGQHIWGSTYYVDVCQSDSSIKNAISSDDPELEHDFKFESGLPDNVHMHSYSVKQEKFDIYQKEELTINCNMSSGLILHSRMEITDCAGNDFTGQSSIIDTDEMEKSVNVDDKSNKTKIFNSTSDSNNMELTMNNILTRQSTNLMQNSVNCTKIFDCSFSNKVNLTGDYGIVVCDSICGSNNSSDLVLCDSIMNGEETRNSNISNNAEYNMSNNCTNMLNTSAADNSFPLSEKMSGIFSDSGACESTQGNAISSTNKIKTIEGPFEITKFENQNLLCSTETCGENGNNNLSVEAINDYQAKICNVIYLGNEKVIEACSKTCELSPKYVNDALRSEDTKIVSLTDYNSKSSCTLSNNGKPTIVNQEIQNPNTHNSIYLEHCNNNYSPKESTVNKNLKNEHSKCTNDARDLSQNNSCSMSIVNLHETNNEYMNVITDTHFVESQKEPSVSNSEISNNKATVHEKGLITNNIEINASLANKCSDFSGKVLDGSNSSNNTNKFESCNNFTSDRNQVLEETENNRIIIVELPRIVNEICKEKDNHFVIESKNCTNIETLNNGRDLCQNNSCSLSIVNVQETNNQYMDAITKTHFVESENNPDISNNEISNSKVTVHGKEIPITNNIENNASLTVQNKHFNVSEIFLDNNCIDDCDTNKSESFNHFTSDINQVLGETENSRILTAELPRSAKENISTESTNKSEIQLNLGLISHSTKFNNSNSNSENHDLYCIESHTTTVPLLEISNSSIQNLNQTPTFNGPEDNIKCKPHATAQNLMLSYQKLIENGDSELEIMNNSGETSVILETSRKRRKTSSYYLAPKKKNITEKKHLIPTTKEFDDVNVFNNGVQNEEKSKPILTSDSHFDKSGHSAFNPKRICMEKKQKLNDCKTQEDIVHLDILDVQKINTDFSNFTQNHELNDMYIENESVLKDPSISFSLPDDDWKFSKEIDTPSEMKDTNTFKRKPVDLPASWGAGNNVIGTPLNLVKHLIQREIITPVVLKESNGDSIGRSNVKTVGYCSMENIFLTESEKQEIESNVRRKLIQSFQNDRLESLKEECEEIPKKLQTLMNKTQLNSENNRKYSTNSLFSDCNSSNDMTISSDFDNSLYLTKGPLSAKDYIIDFKESNKCIWELEHLSEGKWSFSFLRNTFTLVVLLEGKLITEIKFLPTEVGDDQVMKFIQHVVIKSFSQDKIEALCKTECDVMYLLTEISRKIDDMLTFKWDIELLQDCYKLEFVSYCASLRFRSFKSHLRFKLTVDFCDWDKIQPEHISVKDAYGNLRVQDVVNLSSGIQKDSHFLINYIKSIHEYLKVIDKYSK